MKRAMKCVAAALMQLVGVALVLFGIAYLGFGLIWYQLCSSSIASGEPDGTFVLLGALVIVVGAVLCWRGVVAMDHEMDRRDGAE